ncbi:MAG: hypothetical protein RDV48_29145 [Candidatus Eremiobacteraeota bacterium]|nr:hypothetical protein [Candidatus Eremiobacteraeota bacterium]
MINAYKASHFQASTNKFKWPYILSNAILGIAWPEVTSNYAAYMIAECNEPNYSRAFSNIYLSSTAGIALQTFALAQAYRRRHGACPDTLRKAFEEYHLEVPAYPATGAPPGYRLEGGHPRLWCAGFDNKDDGGTTQSDETDYEKSPKGANVIYEWGIIPSWLR